MADIEELLEDMETAKTAEGIGAILGYVIDDFGGAKAFANAIYQDYAAHEPGNPVRQRIGTALLNLWADHGPQQDGGEDLGALKARAAKLIEEHADD